MWEDIREKISDALSLLAVPIIVSVVAMALLPIGLALFMKWVNCVMAFFGIV